jgi:lysophospholipase L1-like esterase
VSTLLGRQALNDQYNAALQKMVDSRHDDDKHIMLVPIGSAVQPDELVDGIHPNDVGYHDIAVAWMQSVDDAQERGWFQKPEAGTGT